MIFNALKATAAFALCSWVVWSALDILAGGGR